MLHRCTCFVVRYINNPSMLLQTHTHTHTLKTDTTFSYTHTDMSPAAPSILSRNEMKNYWMCVYLVGWSMRRSSPIKFILKYPKNTLYFFILYSYTRYFVCRLNKYPLFCFLQYTIVTV